MILCVSRHHYTANLQHFGIHELVSLEMSHFL